MPLRIEDIRRLEDPWARAAAAQELLDFATARAEEARVVRDTTVQELRVGGNQPAEITRRAGVRPHTVKALTRSLPRSGT